MQDTSPTPDPLSNDTVNNMPSDPDTIANPPESTLQPAKKKNSLLVLIAVMFVTILLVPAFQQTQTLISNAAGKKCMMITKVMINPGEIITNIGKPPIELSVLAYDANGNPVTKGVKYDWGISSTNSVGTLKVRHDIATFTALNIGTGDLYVKTSNNCTKKPAVGSVKINVLQEIIMPPTN